MSVQLQSSALQDLKDPPLRVLGPRAEGLASSEVSAGFGVSQSDQGDEERFEPIHEVGEGLFKVKRLSPFIGAEIGGIDLAKPVDAALKKALRAALLEYKVIFFRDQDITTQQHMDFGRLFGDLEIHPFAASKEGFPEILRIHHNRDNSGKENVWHSDVTWRLEPSLGSILRALHIPDRGGDTLFADMYAAYEDLSDEIKNLLDGMIAVHDFEPFRRRLVSSGASKEKIEKFNRDYPDARHPVVRTHPETGRKGLYVNAAFTRRIEGMKEDESKALLGRLYAQATVPEFQCRFHWTKNAMAFWDNRCTQHYAVSDYWPQSRIMERVTVKGDKPF